MRGREEGEGRKGGRAMEGGRRENFRMTQDTINSETKGQVRNRGRTIKYSKRDR